MVISLRGSRGDWETNYPISVPHPEGVTLHDVCVIYIGNTGGTFQKAQWYPIFDTLTSGHPSYVASILEGCFIILD